MKTDFTVAALAGLGLLAACNNSAVENKADTIEANAEAQADALDDMAENTTNETMEAGLENKADATREAGDEAADNVRETDNTQAGNDSTDR